MPFREVEADRRNIADQSVFPVAHNQPSEPFDFAPVEPTYAAAFVGGAPPIQEYGVPYAGGAAPINEYGGPYVGGTASVNGYGVPSVGGAAPSNGYDIAPVEVAAPVHDHGIAPVGLAVPIPEIGAHAMIELPIPAQNDPFVTSIANSAPESSTASSSASNPAGSAPADPIPAASSAPTSAPQQAPRKSKSKSRWTEAELARLVYLKEEKNYEWVDILRVSKKINKHTYAHTHTHRQLMKLSKAVRRNLKFAKLTSIPDYRILALTPGSRFPTSIMNFAARGGASRSKLSRGNVHKKVCQTHGPFFLVMVATKS